MLNKINAVISDLCTPRGLTCKGRVILTSVHGDIVFEIMSEKHGDDTSGIREEVWVQARKAAVDLAALVSSYGGLLELRLSAKVSNKHGMKYAEYTDTMRPLDHSDSVISPSADQIVKPHSLSDIIERGTRELRSDKQILGSMTTPATFLVGNREELDTLLSGVAENCDAVEEDDRELISKELRQIRDAINIIASDKLIIIMSRTENLACRTKSRRYPTVGDTVIYGTWDTRDMPSMPPRLTGWKVVTMRRKPLTEMKPQKDPSAATVYMVSSVADAVRLCQRATPELELSWGTKVSAEEMKAYVEGGIINAVDDSVALDKIVRAGVHMSTALSVDGVAKRLRVGDRLLYPVWEYDILVGWGTGAVSHDC